MLFRCFIFIFLFLLPANAIFLVGEGKVNEPVSVLCEGWEFIYVSFPNGSTEKIALDENFEANFLPASSGPHAVLCGNETKAIFVKEEKTAEILRHEEGFPYAFVFLFSAFVILLSFLFAKRFFIAKTEFLKRIDGNKIQLLISAGERLEKIEITDEKMKFSLPFIEAGGEFSLEYESDAPSLSVAVLEATKRGKRITIASKVEGLEKTPALLKKEEKVKRPLRKLPKAA